MRKALGALVVVAIAALALLPMGSAHEARAAGPLRLTVGTLGPIGSLDPRRGCSDVAKEVWKLQYPTLTSLDPKTLDPKPGLASAWSPSANGKGWVYKLWPGLAWSDGRPVTAADVVYSLVHARDDDWRCAPVSVGAFAGLDAQEIDSRTVEITPRDIDRILPGLLLHVVPEHVFAKVANLDTNVAQLGVSDGSWQVVAKSADSVEMHATAKTGGPTLEQIVFRAYSDADSLIQALEQKRVDVVSGLPSADIGRIAALPGVTIDHATDGSQWRMRIRVPDARVRQAISLAIDRTALVTDAVDGVGTPGVVPIIAWGATWALDDASVQSLTAALDAQPARARRLLATAPTSGRTLTVGIQQNADARRVGELVRRALSSVGINTKAVDADEEDGYFRSDLVVYRDRYTDNPFYPNSALDGVTCNACGRSAHLPSTDFTKLVAIAHSRLQHVTAEARVVGLFEPDTLQAFRSDNVTGFLRDPEIRSLVVFGPTVSQYFQLIAAPPPPGEQLSNTAYAVGAVIVLTLCIAAFLFAAWIRRRFVNEGAP